MVDRNYIAAYCGGHVMVGIENRSLGLMIYKIDMHAIEEVHHSKSYIFVLCDSG